MILAVDGLESYALVGYGVHCSANYAVFDVGDGVLDSLSNCVKLDVISSTNCDRGNLIAENVGPTGDYVTGNLNVVKRLTTKVLEELTGINKLFIKVVEDLVGDSLATTVALAGLVVVVVESRGKNYLTYGTDLSVFTISFFAFGVTEFCNGLLSNENLVTNGTLNTCGKTGFGTSGSNCINGSFGVAESGSKNFVTYGTDLSVFTISCCAFGVTECCNGILSNENLVTNGTLNTCGKTGFGTSGSNCINGSFGVAESGNLFLRLKSDATNGTLLTCGKTGFGTSGSNCINSYGIMNESRNECGFYGLNTANRTLLTCGVTVLFASSGNLGDIYLGVTESRIENYATYGTGLSNKTASCLAGSVLAGSCNGILSNENLVTYGTVRTFGKTVLSTSGGNGVIDHYGVRSGNYVLCYGDLATSVTLLTFGKTVSGTSSCNCLKGGKILVSAIPLSGKSYVGEYLISGEVPLLFAVIPTCEVVAVLGRIEGLLNKAALLYGLSVYSGAALAVEGYIELLYNSGPLSDKGYRLGYGALCKVPGLTAKIPTVEGVTLSGRSLRLGNECAHLNVLRGNLGATLTVELYFERFCLGRSTEQIAGSECEYYCKQYEQT